jgi:hypothetical protein
MDFFEYLDQQGGFYYERWGDAPVHSIGAALFAKKDQIHFFDDIGYRHEPFQVSGSYRQITLLIEYSIARKAKRIREGSAGAISTTISIGSGMY